MTDGLTPGTPGCSVNDKARGKKKKEREEKRELAAGFVAKLPNKT